MSKVESAEQVYGFICGYLEQHQQLPTWRQISVGTGVSEWSVGLAMARLQGQGRVRDGSTLPVDFCRRRAAQRLVG